MIDGSLLEKLRQVSAEEEQILAGKKEIDRQLYTDKKSMVVDGKKMLERGKLIQVRTHTRFIHFPKHTHNYVEVIFMCSGSTTHFINGDKLELHEGELLFLNRNAIQEIMPAGENDIAVNFIILPEFFDKTLQMLGDERSLLREFIVDCLREKNSSVGYLHFKVADVLPIQNLVENLIWSIMHRQQNKRSINQMTMGLLFIQLLNYTDKASIGRNDYESNLTMQVLRYVEEKYRDGELAELAEELGYDVAWLSRAIKKQTGKTYTQLVQEKRMGQAVYLLTTTKLTIEEIALAVGYDNISYFYRLFEKFHGESPRTYRRTKQI